MRMTFLFILISLKTTTEQYYSFCFGCLNDLAKKELILKMCFYYCNSCIWYSVSLLDEQEPRYEVSKNWARISLQCMKHIKDRSFYDRFPKWFSIYSNTFIIIVPLISILEPIVKWIYNLAYFIIIMNKINPLSVWNGFL